MGDAENSSYAVAGNEGFFVGRNHADPYLAAFRNLTVELPQLRTRTFIQSNSQGMATES